MKLDSGMRDFIRQAETAFPPDTVSLPVARQRELYRELCRAFDRPRPPNLTVTDRTIAAGDHDVPIRIYRPAGQGDLSCLIYLHGGGWVLGDLDSHDGITAELAVRAEITVIAVDYRLAPEHPFPAAFEDCAAVLDAVFASPADFGIDAARIQRFVQTAPYARDIVRTAHLAHEPAAGSKQPPNAPVQPWARLSRIHSSQR